MLVNGINKYVAEMSDETQENRTDDIGDSTGRLVAKARPTQTPRPTSSSPTVTIPYHHRKWIDVEPGEVRHDQIASAFILQFLEKKTEQSNSEPWQRCFTQNLHLLRSGQSEHGWLTCKEEVVQRRDFSVLC